MPLAERSRRGVLANRVAVPPRPVPRFPTRPQWPMRGSSSALRAARARRGINDALLRRVSGLPASAWGQLTPGARQPGVARLLRLADAVDVAVDDLPDPGRPSG
jgi:hypothetical protein